MVPSTQVLADYYHLHPERVLAQHQVTAEAQQLLTKFRSKHLSSCHERVLIGNAADVIVEYARDKDFDMIIMGTHGRRRAGALHPGIGGRQGVEILHRAGFDHQPIQRGMMSRCGPGGACPPGPRPKWN